MVDRVRYNNQLWAESLERAASGTRIQENGKDLPMDQIVALSSKTLSELSDAIEKAANKNEKEELAGLSHRIADSTCALIDKRADKRNQLKCKVARTVGMIFTVAFSLTGVGAYLAYKLYNFENENRWLKFEKENKLLKEGIEQQKKDITTK